MSAPDAVVPDSDSSGSWPLRLWGRVPLAIRAFVSGFLVFQLLQFGWAASFFANAKYLPQIPWNVPVGLLYLWLVFGYLNGRGWPESTARARGVAMRARALSRQQWLWSLVYSFVCLVFLASIINVVYRFIKVPEAGLMDTSMFPWWSLYPSLIMLSVNAGVSEEAGFRGYMQGGLERRYGPVLAIICTSIVFWVAHFNHTTGVARFALLLGYGAALGALSWAAQSIWPAIVTHAFCDAVSFTTLASDFGPDWFMKKPAPFGETGVDGPFVVFSLLLIASVLAGIAVLRRLRLSRAPSSSS